MVWRSSPCPRSWPPAFPRLPPQHVLGWTWMVAARGKLSRGQLWSLLQSLCPQRVLLPIKTLKFHSFVLSTFLHRPWEGTVCKQVTVHTKPCSSWLYDSSLSARIHLLGLTGPTGMPGEEPQEPGYWGAGSIAVTQSTRKKYGFNFPEGIKDFVNIVKH